MEAGGIRKALQEVRCGLPPGVSLVAVSKTHPAGSVMEAYSAGQRAFGENRPQEMAEKRAALPEDIEWHMIGRLQTNKVKMIAPFVAMIHSVDSDRLLREINRQAERCGRTISCLLEVRVAQEDTKAGFLPGECRAFLEEGGWRSLRNVRICGLMCMATNTDDEERVRGEFRTAYGLFRELKESFFRDSAGFRFRSWGMSHDYKTAVSEGANIVRIGTRIFGARG